MRVEPPTVEEIRAAATRLSGVVTRTPLVPLDGASGILLKPEILQSVGSFKLRGVFHAVSRFTEVERARGLSTVSAGNTAQALAWCGRHFGVPARSVMPEGAPAAKIDAVRRLGGEPVLVPVDDLFRYMREAGWEREPYAFVHPWTNREVMTGHGTIALEIDEEATELDSVFIPVGGGGLLGGVGRALRKLRPGLRIVAVEPEGCPALHESLRRGEPARVECKTICDGVAVPYITDEMFPILREACDEVRLVPEEEVRATIRRLALRDNLVACGSGALATAAALAEPESKRGRAISLVTGGPIATELLQAILA